MSDCIFCKIINNEIPSPRVYEDDNVIVIRDINPHAPTHLLAIPKKHYPAIHDVPQEESALFGQLLNACRATIREQNIEDKGYRLVINSGLDAGQTIDHIHMHILSGRKFSSGLA